MFTQNILRWGKFIFKNSCHSDKNVKKCILGLMCIIPYFFVLSVYSFVYSYHNRAPSGKSVKSFYFRTLWEFVENVLNVHSFPIFSIFLPKDLFPFQIYDNYCKIHQMVKYLLVWSRYYIKVVFPHYLADCSNIGLKLSFDKIILFKFSFFF